MDKIGGNIDCVLKYESVTDSFGRFEAVETGEQIKTLVELLTVKGFLDLMSNGKDYATYNKAMSESTHVFVCDYVSIVLPNGKKAKATELKATIDGEDYDVQYIDDPMGLHYHLEIFLKKVA